METNAEKAIRLHKEWKGKISTEPKCEVKTREDLALAYTPGVAEPCKVIHEDVKEAYTYTLKQNTIAVVSDGSAVLGLGNIGPEAAMPVMEGKCALFKAFGARTKSWRQSSASSLRSAVSIWRIFPRRAVLKSSGGSRKP